MQTIVRIEETLSAVPNLPEPPVIGDSVVSKTAGGAGRFRSRFGRIAAAASLGGVVLLGVILLTLNTPNGEVVIELADGVDASDIRIEVSGQGRVHIADAEQGWSIDIDEGEYEARLVSGQDQFQLSTDRIVVKRNEMERLVVRFRTHNNGPPEDTPTALMSDAAASLVVAQWVLADGGSVTITRDPAQPHAAQHIESLAALPSEPFYISEVIGAGNPVTVEQLNSLASLKTVWKLTGIPWTDQTLKFVPASPHLTTIAFSEDSPVSGNGIASLSRLTRLTSLEGLSTDDQLRGAGQLRRLESVHGGGPQITDTGLEHLLGLRKLAGLSLWDDAIPDSAVPKIAEGLPNLITLARGNRPITFPVIQMAAQLPRLHELQLTGELDDNAWSGFAKLTQVRHMYLSGIRIPDQDVQPLLALTELISLRIGQTGFEQRHIDLIHKALPNCEIIWDGGTIMPEKTD
ncbi:MAG: hypothetical protein GY903_34505 [Fuerstiella sp.]|nr:hypothetical protein [Fuerstiella sp.]MCP4859603.1 hypothetical protein [Fuerstiella sp.]